MSQHLTIEDADLIFENKKVKVIANYSEPEIKLAGFKVGPFEEGREYEIRFWVAQNLEEKGVIRFKEEDLLNVVKLHKIHWMERVQHANKASSLPEDFYPQLRRLLTQLETSKANGEKLKELEKSMRLSQDIVNCRVKKIVSLSSSLPLASQALQNLTPEEKSLYNCLHKIINDWREKILERGKNNGRS
jgi:hypothetical protein